MVKFFIFSILIVAMQSVFAQLVDLQYSYNNVGDCSFGAMNNSKTPLYIHVFFTNIEYTTFKESTPYVKKLDPGYNGLFTLLRESENSAPQFIIDQKTYRSDPLAKVNVDFPYLVPFAPGTKVKPIDVKSIAGFWGNEEPKSWQASGFSASPGEPVYTARQGQVVEITGSTRGGDPQLWYNTWTNAITLLQPDGTLITYKNVVDKEKKLELNQKIQAGESLGEVAANSSEVVLLIYHNKLNSPDLDFVIPLFVTAPGKTEILNPTLNIEVVHPAEIRAIEMTKKEQKKLLKSDK